MCSFGSTEYHPKIPGGLEMFFGKYETSLCVFLVSAVICGSQLSHDAIVAQCLTYHGALDFHLGSFGTSSMSHRNTLGGILEDRPLPGRFSTVPRFLHRLIMALIMVHWRPWASDFVTLPGLTDFTDLVHICSCIIAFWEPHSLLHIARQVLFK